MLLREDEDNELQNALQAGQSWKQFYPVCHQPGYGIRLSKEVISRF